MVDVFSEVDDDLRREKLTRLWKKIGPFVIGGAVVVVASMGGRVYWQDYVAKQKIQESQQYQAALSSLEAGNDTEAEAALENLITNSKYGYGLLASLQSASNMAKTGDTEGALAAYDAISADAGLTQKFRDYGALMSVLILIDQGGREEAYDRLVPLVRQGSDWYYSANETLALMYFTDERFEDAEGIFLLLRADPGTPPDLKNRAAEFMAMVQNKKPAVTLANEKEEEAPATP